MKESDKVISINPSRWFAGGKGLNPFRKMMLSNKNIKEIIHFDNSKDTFGNFVDITGGISYMLIDNNYIGSCKFNKQDYDISKYDILVSNINSISLINKFEHIDSISSICMGRGDNNFKIQSNDKRLKDNPETNDIKCFVSKNKGFEKWINKYDITFDYNCWKVITAEANGSYPRFGNKFIGNKNEVCSGSYIWFKLKSEKEANSFLTYISTNFANYLLSIRKISQHIKPDTCKWIPLVPFDREWTDELLFDYFNLTEEERNIVLNYDKK